MFFRRSAETVITLVLLLVFLAGYGQAQDDHLRAIGSWQSSGAVFKVENDLLFFVGIMGGFLFVGNAEGPLNAAAMECPGTFETDLKKGTQSAEGRCILTTVKGDKAYGKWTCSGIPGNCGGKFSFTGGTGRFQGITGNNDFVAYSAFIAVKETGTGSSAMRASGGILLWPRINYKLPSSSK